MMTEVRSYKKRDFKALKAVSKYFLRSYWNFNEIVLTSIETFFDLKSPNDQIQTSNLVNPPLFHVPSFPIPPLFPI